MAYVDQAIDLWKFEQNRDQNARRNFGQGLSNLAGAIDENRQRALATQRAKENQALALSKDGVNPDDISAYQNNGNMSGIQQFYADQNSRQRDLAAAKADRDARLAESQINKNNKYEPPGSKGGNDLSFEDKEKIKAKYRANSSTNSADNTAQKKIVEKNVNLVSVKNAMDSALSQLKDEKIPEDQKVKIGQGLYKLLNSAEGSDAVGAEEAKRIGSYLEYHLGNFTQPGAMFGRDLPGFTKQIENYSTLLGDRVRKNEEMAKGLKQGKSFSQMIEPQQKPKSVIQNGHTYILNEQTGEYE